MQFKQIIYNKLTNMNVLLLKITCRNIFNSVSYKDIILVYFYLVVVSTLNNNFLTIIRYLLLSATCMLNKILIHFELVFTAN